MTAAAARPYDFGRHRGWYSTSGTSAFTAVANPPIISPPSTAAELEWQDEVVARLQELAKLKTNWDRRGSAAVRGDALAFAYNLLQQVMLPTTPLPAIVPLGHGGVLIAWAGPAADVEVEVVAPHEVVAYCLDKSTGAENEWPVAADFSSIAAALHSVAGG